MKAYLKNYRQSPRKVRLVADLVRGKTVDRAMAELSFLPKRSSEVVSKLIRSAAANAEHNFKVNPGELIISEIRVDQGPTLKRWRARAKGTASRINKRTSHVIVSLAPAKVKSSAAKTTEAKKADNPTAKKTAAKPKKAAAKKPATTTSKNPAKKAA